ncbi:MAG TPA: alpha/beta fold hydrolase [Actinomycetota bacterium]|jgi:dipeptidyl aminopeptidase/acylaminoacyl peptidase
MASQPTWERRFRAPQIGFPAWSRAAPDALAYVSNEGGSWQAWALDRASGARRRVTDEPVGVETVLVAPDGRIVWWQDDVGDERGRWMTVPFAGGDPEPLVPGVPRGWAEGIDFADGTIALGIATDDTYDIYVASRGAEARRIASSSTYLALGSAAPGRGGLSANGRLLCVRHTEGRDLVHPALRVLDADGEVVADLADEGVGLDPAAWSPVRSDLRLAFTSELGAFERPAIWDLGSGERRDLTVDVPGAVIPLSWWADGSALLAKHEHEGRDGLLRVDPGTGDAVRVIDADGYGYLSDAGVRPDGQVWCLIEDGATPPSVVAGDGARILAPPGPPAPAGRRARASRTDGPAGPVQSFVVTPEGDGPWPTVLSVHGGPEWHERDRFEPETLALVDAGYAVVLPNYRGSTGYGVAFRRALIGDPWFPELEDVIACLDHAISAGIADPARVAFAGWSWGGCLACLAAGLHPDRFAAVFAGIPSGDLVAAHRACMPELRAYDLALYGGGPDELPELWAERNPMTYVDRVRAPVLVIAGEHDPRCPPEGITPWIHALRDRGVPIEDHFYAEGHHANRTDQQVDHMRRILDFFGRYL